MEDLESRNGLYVNGERVDAVELQPGDEIGLGGSTIRIVGTGMEATQAAAALEAATVLLEPEDLVQDRAENAAATRAVPSAAALAAPSEPVVSPEMLDVDFVALGGGVGSFSWVDLLRCSASRARRSA